MQASFKTIQILYFAMAGSLFIYAGIAHILRSSEFLPEPMILTQLTFLRYGFYILALSIFVLVLWLRKTLLSLEAIRPQVLQGENVEQIIVRGHVILFALCEVPGILGLVLFFLSRSLQDFYLLAGLSLLGFLSSYPNQGWWEEIKREIARLKGNS